MSADIKTNRIEKIMQSWRLRVQTRMMTFGVLLAFPALVQTVWRAGHHPGEWYSAIAFVIMYFGIVGLAIHRKIPVSIRGWLSVVLLYLVGVLAMARGGLWGDGRIYLVLLPVFGMLLININTGKLLITVSILIYAIFGLLNHIGLLERWLISQHGHMSTEIWFYDGLIFAALMITVVIMMVDLSELLMATLSSEHQTAENLLEAHRLLDQTNQKLEEKVSQRTIALAEANQRLRQLVNHNPLTGLPNRILFYDRLSQAIAQAKRMQTKVAVMFIDLDDFKTINDTFGHICGDDLLTKLASRLQEKMRASDTVAHLSGDEFAIILGNLSKPEDAIDSARRILEALADPFDLGASTVSLSASIGISIYPDDAESPDDLVHHADTAMYGIKHTTKRGFHFYANR